MSCPRSEHAVYVANSTTLWMLQVLKFLGAIESSSHTIFSLELYTPDNAVDERGQVNG